MHTDVFYNIIDRELLLVLDKYKDDLYIKKNRSAHNNQKAYALLIWFLDFYGKISDYSNYITDGDQDGSCDIIFDSIDNQGKRIFYIVQSKWNTLENCKKDVEKKDILQALNDFDTIIRGKKEKVNEKLRIKIEALTDHLRENGDVKFIYLTLCNKNINAQDNISSFLENHKKTRFEFYDINRLKVDYIERKFKKIEAINPLEEYYDPEESKITIEIHRLNQSSGNFISLQKPFEAHVFLIKPKTIYELFEKYGFALFFKNVRNPLLQSDFNKDIEETISDNPAYFWYYNNGITAITYLMPEIRNEATFIELTGLQVINGSQTIYSIYRAYRDASVTKRSVMDNEALITLRLLKSGGKDFDLNVTRFNNSQNPINERDFKANDDIQVMLQNDSFKTNFWYEKRRGEFRETPPDVKIVSNEIFANCYLAYQLMQPVSVVMNNWQMRDSKKNLLFVSQKDNQNGLYEKIFNSNSQFDDFITSFYLFDMLIRQHGYGEWTSAFGNNLFHYLSFFRIIFTKYLTLKFGSDINVNRHIRKIYTSKKEGEAEIILKTFKLIKQYTATAFYAKINEKIYDKQTISSFYVREYENLLRVTDNIEIEISTIENMELDIFDITNYNFTKPNYIALEEQ